MTACLPDRPVRYIGAAHRPLPALRRADRVELAIAMGAIVVAAVLVAQVPGRA
jgi:hypothetical protein